VTIEEMQAPVDTFGGAFGGVPLAHPPPVGPAGGTMADGPGPSIGQTDAIQREFLWDRPGSQNYIWAESSTSSQSIEREHA
jgi:hypothetical protein